MRGDISLSRFIENLLSMRNILISMDGVRCETDYNHLEISCASEIDLQKGILSLGGMELSKLLNNITSVVDNSIERGTYQILFTCAGLIEFIQKNTLPAINRDLDDLCTKVDEINIIKDRVIAEERQYVNNEYDLYYYDDGAGEEMHRFCGESLHAHEGSASEEPLSGLIFAWSVIKYKDGNIEFTPDSSQLIKVDAHNSSSDCEPNNAAKQDQPSDGISEVRK